jgi:uncharacterized protein (TIGR02217 family)
MPISSAPVFSVPLRSMPFTRSVVQKSLGVETFAGVDVLQGVWSYPRYKWSLNSGYLRTGASFAELQALVGFFNAVGGRATVFQFDDPFDDSVTDQPLGIGDGTTTAFQMLRAYGGFVEPVFAVNVITNVKLNGAVQGGGTYSVSANGILTFTSAPGVGVVITWTGTYLWFCRMDQDSLDFKMLVGMTSGDPAGWGALFNVDTFSFTSIKLGA